MASVSQCGKIDDMINIQTSDAMSEGREREETSFRKREKSTGIPLVENDRVREREKKISFGARAGKREGEQGEGRKNWYWLSIFICFDQSNYASLLDDCK